MPIGIQSVVRDADTHRRCQGLLDTLRANFCSEQIDPDRIEYVCGSIETASIAGIPYTVIDHLEDDDLAQLSVPQAVRNFLWRRDDLGLTGAALNIFEELRNAGLTVWRAPSSSFVEDQELALCLTQLEKDSGAPASSRSFHRRAREFSKDKGALVVKLPPEVREAPRTRFSPYHWDQIRNESVRLEIVTLAIREFPAAVIRAIEERRSIISSLELAPEFIENPLCAESKRTTFFTPSGCLLWDFLTAQGFKPNLLKINPKDEYYGFHLTVDLAGDRKELEQRIQDRVGYDFVEKTKEALAILRKLGEPPQEWCTKTVAALAWTIVNSDRFRAAPYSVLADALKEAGCDHAEFLGILRSPDILIDHQHPVFRSLAWMAPYW